MLDQRTSALLKKINAVCRGGGYQIVEERELLDCFPSGDRQELRHSLDCLGGHGLIDVKYAEDGVYCLCLLPDGRVYFENAVKEYSDGVRRARGSFLLQLSGSLIGGFLGALFASLIVG